MVKHERLDLDKQKNDLVVKVSAGKRTQVGGCSSNNAYFAIGPSDAELW